MSNFEYNKRVEDFLKANWITTPILIQSVPERDKPKNGFIRSTPLIGKVSRPHVGINSFHRHPMTVIIQVMAPVNNGWQLAMTWSDTIAALFRDNNSGMTGLNFAEVDLVTVGETGNYFQVNVIANGYFDTLPSGTIV